MTQYTPEAKIKMGAPAINGQQPDLSQLEIEGPDYASGWLRLLALIIDSLIFGIFVALLFMLKLGFLTHIVTLGSLFTLYLIVMVAIKQQTFGMLILEIKVISTKQGEVNWWITAVLRELVGRFLCELVFGIGFLWIFFTKKKQGWHDMIASTTVIKE